MCGLLCEDIFDFDIIMLPYTCRDRLLDLILWIFV